MIVQSIERGELVEEGREDERTPPGRPGRVASSSQVVLGGRAESAGCARFPWETLAELLASAMRGI
jgi:hypothetical protein